MTAEKKVVARYRIAEFSSSVMAGGLIVDRQNNELGDHIEIAKFTIMPNLTTYDIAPKEITLRDIPLCDKLFHNVHQVIRFINACGQEAMYIGEVKVEKSPLSEKPKFKIDCENHKDEELSEVSLIVWVWEDHPDASENAYIKGSYSPLFSILCSQYEQSQGRGSIQVSDIPEKYHKDDSIMKAVQAIWEYTFHIAKLLQKAEMHYMYLGDYV